MSMSLWNHNPKDPSDLQKILLYIRIEYHFPIPFGKAISVQLRGFQRIPVQVTRVSMQPNRSRLRGTICDT